MSQDIYPHLSAVDADQAFRSLDASVAAGDEIRSFPDGGLHPRTRYAGAGNQVGVMRMRDLRAVVLARTAPLVSGGRVADARRFDIEAGIALDGWFERDGRSQAARLEIWPYITLIALPDLAVARFSSGAGGGLKAERFLAGRRNVFYRAYLRARILGPLLQDPNVELYEDDLVGLMERNLSSDQRVARAIAENIAHLGVFAGNRRNVVREALKLVQYELKVTDLAVLSDCELKKRLDLMFRAAQAIRR